MAVGSVDPGVVDSGVALVKSDHGGITVGLVDAGAGEHARGKEVELHVELAKVRGEVEGVLLLSHGARVVGVDLRLPVGVDVSNVEEVEGRLEVSYLDVEVA